MTDVTDEFYPELGYYRICVFGPNDKFTGYPMFDRMLTKEQISERDLTEMILERIEDLDVNR